MLNNLKYGNQQHRLVIEEQSAFWKLELEIREHNQQFGK